ncbi:MAG TPA: 2-phospho-L-lactate transferase [Candidatus Limnocylindrales bacterium]
MTPVDDPPVVILAGGTGGAKLADGLDRSLPAGSLTVIVNTADDVERHGLLVMPDHDAVMYLLAGVADHERGWGIRDETWSTIEMLARYGEETWFRLGDHDFGTHIARSRRIADGERLTAACLALQSALGLATRILPMSDDPVRTSVRTPDGWLAFQDYFVRLRQGPDALAVRFDGTDRAEPTPEVLGAIENAAMIVLGPSNPIVSIAPILAVHGLRDAISRARATGTPVVAVSPIVGGRALKGPADRMLASLGHEVSAAGVARLYLGLVDVFVVDTADADLAPAIERLGMHPVAMDTVMTDEAARVRLAGELLALDQDRPPWR